MAKKKKEITPITLFDKNDEGRHKALQAALDDLTKRFGDGTIMSLGDAAHLTIDVIPTGSLGLDIALGVGGLPRGRVTEIYGAESSGKTTLCLHVIREAQKRGGICAFIDMEHALDPIYAERIGVNLDTLYVSQPDTAEQALEIVETLVRSGAMDAIIIDSVAALVPRAEIEGEMGDSHVGLQARLMSQALRKLTGAIKQSNVAVIFTNQLREKIGVMFGCLQHTSLVRLADGTSEQIGKIVKQKMDVEVMSYDVKTGAFEPRRIVNWFDNGITESFLHIAVDSNRPGKNPHLKCTPNHMILTKDGYIPAGDLRIGDHLVTPVKHYLTPAHMQIVYGSILGDGAMRHNASKYNVQLRIGHGAAQNEYCQWKYSLFQGLTNSLIVNSKGGYSFDTIGMYELAEVYAHGYKDRKKHPSDDFITRLSPLAVAIWYVDDGTFYGGLNQHGKPRKERSSICAAGLTVERQQKLLEWFHEHGIDAGLSKRGNIIFTQTGTHTFQRMIAPYVHPSMDYKLFPEYRGQFQALKLEVCERLEAGYMAITDICEVAATHFKHRYDIEIEGNHCYVADGVIVHNSPETQPGGRALKFYASVRLDIRRIQGIKSGEDDVGNRARVKVKKNKVAPPFKECEFDIMFTPQECGISKAGEITDLAVELGIIEKRGAFFRFNDTLLGQGREKTKEYLVDHPVMSDGIESTIRQHFGLPALDAISIGTPVPVVGPIANVGEPDADDE